MSWRRCCSSLPPLKADCLNIKVFPVLLISSSCFLLLLKPGEDVVLQCQGPTDAEIVMFRWVRPDLQSEDFVFIYKDGRLDENRQHEAFRGRVELRDPEMKDGDFSVILKNVRISDTGSYECYVGTNGNKPKLINNISLKVEYPGHGPVGLAVGLTVVGILLLVAAAVGFMFYRKRSSQNATTGGYNPVSSCAGPKSG
uniref:Ig-like domain-containing protein n=1 Tax=Mastacembelus armatus TaxID=205130 RepID=A0A3Q3LMU6_9TELE